MLVTRIMEIMICYEPTPTPTRKLGLAADAIFHLPSTPSSTMFCPPSRSVSHPVGVNLFPVHPKIFVETPERGAPHSQFLSLVATPSAQSTYNQEWSLPTFHVHKCKQSFLDEFGLTSSPPLCMTQEGNSRITILLGVSIQLLFCSLSCSLSLLIRNGYKVSVLTTDLASLAMRQVSLTLT